MNYFWALAYFENCKNVNFYFVDVDFRLEICKAYFWRKFHKAWLERGLPLLNGGQKVFSQNVFEKLWKNGFFIFSDFIDHAAHWGRARPLDPILALLTLTGFERLLQNCDYGFAFYSISRIMLFEDLLYLVIYRAQRSIKANQYYKIIFHI